MLMVVSGIEVAPDLTAYSPETPFLSDRVSDLLFSLSPAFSQLGHLAISAFFAYFSSFSRRMKQTETLRCGIDY